MSELFGLVIPIGIIYLVIKYDKKKYVKSFFKTCLQMLPGAIWGAIKAGAGFRGKIIDEAEGVVTTGARGVIDGMTSTFWGRFRNNVNWAVKDIEIEKLEKEIDELTVLARSNPNAKVQLNEAKKRLSRAKRNQF
ncbi:UNVERIFIED_CONTAM: hypothetical protein KB579_08860 [Streptococcus canis]|uniref:hypothetical protein n=1 Tax=Streptococcus TaxID=1301 RepID=UPI00194EDC1E|nr:MULTISPECIES: hypothetical protein [Streptococcus]MBM6549148.1 hypothetical protein [Streptococcus dysgalactiae subsp. equisimilis]HEL0756575.1 hypothetical protein [Streptococcus equi subsp. zooepidemicus]HEL1155401.1 hypothetical protein [Streptococcus equi subsp. zooepidemicus]HEN6652924.1 hypothetical protein [Streptococcus agalactiae]